MLLLSGNIKEHLSRAQSGLPQALSFLTIPILPAQISPGGETQEAAPHDSRVRVDGDS